MPTLTEAAFKNWLGRHHIPVVAIQERDDGELRVVHQLTETDDESDVEKQIRQVVGLFTGFYPNAPVNSLFAVAVNSQADLAVTYYCAEEWAAAAAESNLDPSVPTEERIAAMMKVEETLDGPLAVNSEPKALLDEKSCP